MKKSTLVAGAVMLGLPFAILAGVYHALPAEIAVLRNPLTGALAIAPKSAFVIFRVPLMNLIHGLMAGLMLTHAADFDDGARRNSFAAAFTALLFAIALKSNFEALEISGLGQLIQPFAGWLTVGTAVSVIGGVALAFVRGRRVPLPWPELRLPTRDKVTLAGLFVAYLAIVSASILIGRRG
jgi:hypothetical protein